MVPLHIALLAIPLVSLLKFTLADDLVRACYYTNWSVYRPGEGKYDLEKHYQNGMCSHVIYAFAKVEFDGTGYAIRPTDEYYDTNTGYRVLNQVLKKRDRNLKTLLAIGGWKHASKGFTDMVKTKESRAYFIKQSKEFLIKYSFDGLDLDWEYPAQRGSPQQDKENFALLCEELRAYYGKMLVTAAVAAGTASVDISYDVPRISKALDFINLMTYDLHGSWEKYTGHHTDMNPSRQYPEQHSLYNSVYHWMERGAPANKLVLGLATYGRTWKLDNTCGDWKIGTKASGGGLAGKYTRQQGFLAYYEVCQKNWTQHQCTQQSEAKAPYGTDNRDWIGYDDPESITHKIKMLVKHSGLRGFMFWALDLDDFRGSCGKGTYPLMTAATIAALGLPYKSEPCQQVMTKKCEAPPISPTITTKIGGNGCRVNKDGPWANFPGMDEWCKHSGNCPNADVCGESYPGCRTCHCTCESQPEATTTTTTTTTTMKPATTKKSTTTDLTVTKSTTTTIESKTPDPTSTKEITTTKSTIKTNCVPLNIYRDIVGYKEFCSSRCAYCHIIALGILSYCTCE